MEIRKKATTLKHYSWWRSLGYDSISAIVGWILCCSTSEYSSLSESIQFHHGSVSKSNQFLASGGTWHAQLIHLEYDVATYPYNNYISPDFCIAST